MRNHFDVRGYAVNKRGLTVGVAYQIVSSDVKHATAHAMSRAQQEGFTHIRINYTREVRA